MLGFSAEVANDHGHLPTRCGALPAARHQQDVRGPFYASRADEERAAQKGKGAPRRKQSLRTGRWKFGAAIERERPEKRFAMCGADEARSIQDRSHLLRRVHEDAKLVPSDPEEEVHYRESRPQVPAVGRMREGQQTSDFGKEHTCAGVRTAALVTPLVARRHAGIEEARGSAIAGATRHTVHLEAAIGRRLEVYSKAARG